jgi:hypothetical protein
MTIASVTWGGRRFNGGSTALYLGTREERCLRAGICAARKLLFVLERESARQIRAPKRGRDTVESKTPAKRLVKGMHWPASIV